MSLAQALVEPDFFALLGLGLRMVKMAEATIRTHANVGTMEETRRTGASLVGPESFFVAARAARTHPVRRLEILLLRRGEGGGGLDTEDLDLPRGH